MSCRSMTSVYATGSALPTDFGRCLSRKWYHATENDGNPIAPPQPGISGVRLIARSKPGRFGASAHRGGTMADQKKRLDSNVAGNFFVDATCINCDACRQLAPDSFEEIGEFSAVVQQ